MTNNTMPSSGHNLFFPAVFTGKQLNEIHVEFIRVCNLSEISSAINYYRFYRYKPLQLLDNPGDIYYFDKQQSLQCAKRLNSFAISVKFPDNARVCIDVYKFGRKKLAEYFTKQYCLRFVSDNCYVLEKLNLH